MAEIGEKLRDAAKTSRIPIKITPVPVARKPGWIRVRLGAENSRFTEIKQILREANLHTVCEEASCPNIGERFGKGTATFMIMGDICTRRCPFCDPLDHVFLANAEFLRLLGNLLFDQRRLYEAETEQAVLGSHIG
jgi:hypothetical protein